MTPNRTRWWRPTASVTALALALGVTGTVVLPAHDRAAAAVHAQGSATAGLTIAMGMTGTTSANPAAQASLRDGLYGCRPNPVVVGPDGTLSGTCGGRGESGASIDQRGAITGKVDVAARLVQFRLEVTHSRSAASTDAVVIDRFVFTGDGTAPSPMSSSGMTFTGVATYSYSCTAGGAAFCAGNVKSQSDSGTVPFSMWVSPFTAASGPSSTTAPTITSDGSVWLCPAGSVTVKTTQVVRSSAASAPPSPGCIAMRPGALTSFEVTRQIVILCIDAVVAQMGVTPESARNGRLGAALGLITIACSTLVVGRNAYDVAPEPTRVVDVALRLSTGRARFTPATEGLRVSIATSAGSIASSGPAVYAVEPATDSTVVDVVAGSVTVAPADDPTRSRTVTAGQRATVTAGTVTVGTIPTTGGTGAGLDPAKVRAVVEANAQGIVAELRDHGTTVTSGMATCPTKIAVQRGATFSCTIKLAGQTVTYRFTQTDGAGGLSFERLDAIVVTSLAADAVAEAAGSAAASCGTRPVLVVRPGKSFDCTARVGARKVVYRVRVTDVAGSVTIARVG